MIIIMVAVYVILVSSFFLFSLAVVAKKPIPPMTAEDRADYSPKEDHIHEEAA